MRLRPVLAPLALLALPLAAPALAAPTCTTVPTAACGGRVVAEPELSTTFHQFDGPVESVGASLEAIEALAPRYLEVMTMAEANGNDTHISAGGRPLWVVRVTDEEAPRAGKAQVAVSLSVHGLEAAGREGGLRYVEDLARSTPETLLYAGDTGFPFSEVMRRTETWIAFTNSDGWAAGDLTTSDPGPGFQRGNANGADLNRDLATVGWYDHSGGRGLAESEPETRAWTTLVKSFPNLKTSTDIHGELTTPNDAFSDLIIPAGQWTPQRQDQVNQLSLNMIRTVERKFEQHGVILDDVFGPLPSDGATPRRAANVAAAYDIVGYDDSGFMGDWFSQTQDAVHMDVENFLSNLAPNNVWNGAVEQAHVAAVRGNIEATIVESLITDQVRPSADYGRVAYVMDPNRTSSDPAVDDGVPGTGADLEEGETQTPYDVSRMDYFPVLAEAFDAEVAPVTAEAVASGTDLTRYDTLVVADMELPRGSTADRTRYLAALDAFAKGGGQLLLTDRAVSIVEALGIIGAGEAGGVTVNKTDAGHVDFVAPLGDHPLEKGLVGKPSQTWYEVMLGYPSRNQAPNYGVLREVWEAAGGETVATVGDQGATDSPNTALGSIERGAGKVTIFGSILPQAIETLEGIETPHPFGLASYAPTITGGQVLDNILAFRGTNRTGATVVTPPVVTPPTAPVPDTGSLPTTGLPVLLPLGAVLLLGSAAVVRRRRSAQPAS
ncbi:MAG: M14 family zinc carboxypeptidase [Mycobacteriales bacterium]|nr:M14 family zinc carboxypeptidase [Mycobacteriales bacterium]